MGMAKVLVIDNYDSFTYNLVHYLQKLKADVIVKKNDAISIQQIETLSPTHILLSPGPCTPNKAGICLDLVETFKAKIPLLGVCLGHQAIAQCFGAKIVRADKIMHGKTSLISHSNQGIFTGLPQKFQATRYHSLVVEKNSLPATLESTAWTEGQKGKPSVIMAIKHKEFNIEGVQFHPESILSEFGLDLLKGFLYPSPKTYESS